MGTSAHEREDHVLTAFLHYLHEIGVSADLAERPDRTLEAHRRFPTGTTDALLDIQEPDGATQTWAVDVTALALPPQWYPAQRALDERFTGLAEEHALAIRLTGTLPAPAEVAGLSVACERAIQSLGTTGSAALSDQIEAHWLPAPDTPADQRLVLDVWMPTRSALLSEQIEDSIGPTLTRKMHGQGQRAQDAGAKYVILIDWAGGDHIAQGTHWLPRHPATVRKAVTNVLKSLAQTPDFVYLLDRADRWHALYEKSASNQHVSGSASGT